MSTSTKPISAISPFWDATVSAFWVAFLAILGVNIIGNGIMPHEEAALETFAYPIEAMEEEAVADSGGGGGGQRVTALPLLAAADPEAGKAVFRKCLSCHTIDAGGKNGTGPNLHNIVGESIGDRNGFKTSASLQAIGGTWTYEKLEDYMENPKRLAPKGIMSFAGIKKPKERADVIRFLAANTENPLPFPAAEAPAGPAEAAPAPAEAAPAEPPKAE
ncbi:MAG: cytochrome c family protein [Rhodospirillaceae bacterium]|nr:cytochrome c family protein [Rhodospirillaceae bacterium]